MTLPPVVAVGRRSRLYLAVAGVLTVVAFGWPLLMNPGSGLQHVEDAPLVFALTIPVLIAIVVAQFGDGGMDAKSVAMLGVLSALGAGLRPLGAGMAGVEPVFFLLILGGRVFGPGFGFVLGSTTMFASALLTAGVGPWLPFQMLGASWIAFGAGLLPPVSERWERWMLAAFGAVSALLFGLGMNLSFWPFTLGADTQISFVAGAPILDNLRRFLIFDLTTSLGWDVGRVITTAGLILTLGRPTLRILRRASHRAAFGVAGEFSPEAQHGVSGSQTSPAGR